MERQIHSMLYERLLLSNDKDAVLAVARRERAPQKPQEIIKDPMVLEFLGLQRRAHYYESDLETELISHLQEFILELGNGFCFVDRQKRILLEDDEYFVDLVFYNRLIALTKLAREYNDGKHGDRTLVIGVLADMKNEEFDNYIDFMGGRRSAYLGVEKLSKLLKAACLYASPELIKRGEVAFTFYDLVPDDNSTSKYPLTAKFYQYIQRDVERWPQGWIFLLEDIVD